MAKSRSTIEDELEKFGLVSQNQAFLDWCEENGGQLDMRMVDDVACAVGPGDINYEEADFEDQVQGDLTVVSYDAGFPRISIHHYSDGEQLSNTFLEGCRIRKDGDVTCEGGAGEHTGINLKY